MLEKNGIIYDFLQEKDLDETIACFVDVFTSSDYLIHSMGITKDEYYPKAESTCKHAVNEQLSHIAKDTKSGRIIGFVLCQDLLIDIPNVPSKLMPMKKINQELQRQYMIGKTIKKGEVIHMLNTGVDGNYRKQGIARTLVAETLKEAKRKNFVRAVCEVTGNISYQGAIKDDFKPLVSIPYKDFLYEGIKVFERLEESYILLEKFL